MTRALDGCTTSQLMLMLKALDRSAGLHFSEVTAQWFVDTRVEIGDGSLLTGVTEHADTPDEAVRACLGRLVAVREPEFIVSGYLGQRREWRWNGAAFAEVSREVVAVPL